MRHIPGVEWWERANAGRAGVGRRPTLLAQGLTAAASTAGIGTSKPLPRM